MKSIKKIVCLKSLHNRAEDNENKGPYKWEYYQNSACVDWEHLNQVWPTGISDTQFERMWHFYQPPFSVDI